jgi:hypothetical protein
MNKESVAYILTVRKNKIISCPGKWVKLEIIMFNKISQTQKDKYGKFSFICGMQT